MAQNRMICWVVLIEIPFVVGSVDERFARWDVGGHAMLGQATANTEHHVSLAQEVIHGAGHDPASSPEGQRMVLGKGTFPFQGSHHRYLEQLGQFHQLSTGFSIQYPLS